jgi:phage-related baseplate assembly protein
MIQNAIDLSKLPVPLAIEEIAYEDLLASLIADFKEKLPAYDNILESDPIYKIFEVAAYREYVLRNRINEACKSLMIAYAYGADLEHLASFKNMTRFEGESDDALRLRVVLAPEGYSVAGPVGAYLFHALSSHEHVKDALPISPTAGQVLVTILSTIDDGTANQILINHVQDYLSSDTIRPLTDEVIVQSAEIVPYTIEAELIFYSGPDSNLILDKATQNINAFVLQRHKIGQDIILSNIYSALHIEGVYKVNIISPEEDIIIDQEQAPYCTNITLNNGGVHE